MEVMVDIETMAVSHKASILTIGAIKFNRKDPLNKKLEDHDTFYCRVDLKSCLDMGLDYDKNTEKWWKSQPPEISKEVFDHNDRLDIRDALVQFHNWYNFTNISFVWGHGCAFDIPILESAFKACSIIPPWKFWQVRDTRTTYDLCKVYLSADNSKHHALYDCYNQIVKLKECIQKIKKMAYE